MCSSINARSAALSSVVPHGFEFEFESEAVKHRLTFASSHLHFSHITTKQQNQPLRFVLVWEDVNILFKRPQLFYRPDRSRSCSRCYFASLFILSFRFLLRSPVFVYFWVFRLSVHSWIFLCEKTHKGCLFALLRAFRPVWLSHTHVMVFPGSHIFSDVWGMFHKANTFDFAVACANAEKKATARRNRERKHL